MEENGGQVDSYGQGANTYGQSEEQDAAEGWANGGGWGQGGAEEEQQQVLKRLKVSKRFKVSKRLKVSMPIILRSGQGQTGPISSKRTERWRAGVGR